MLTLSAMALLKSRLGSGERELPAAADDRSARHQPLDCAGTAFRGTFRSVLSNAYEALVDSALGLVAKVVVNAGNDDDHPVAGIRGLADEPGVVGGLAGWT